MRAVQAEIVINSVLWIGAGFPPFRVEPVSTITWMVTGREGDNCIAYARDGLRAVFDDERMAILLCQELNGRARS